MCRIKVKKALTDLVHKSLKPNVSSVDLSTGVAMLTKDADISAVTKLIKGGNEKYNAKIITYTKPSDNDLPGYVTINPSEGMIDAYYPMYEAWEAKQANRGNDIYETKTKEVLDDKVREKLLKILKGLNVTVAQDADYLLDKSNFPDAMSAFDVLQKFMAIRKNINNRDLSLQTANVLYTFMGRKSKLSLSLWKDIDKWEGYQEVYDKFNKNKTDFAGVENITENEVNADTSKNSFAHRQAIVNFIANQLENAIDNDGFTVNQKTENVDIDATYFQKRGFKNDKYEKNPFKKLMYNLWNWINEKILKNKKFDDVSIEQLTTDTMEIVNDVYKDDFSKFFRKYNKNSDGKITTRDGVPFEQKNYDETWKKDPFAYSVFEKLSQNPFINFKLSGSQVLRKYGTLYRSEAEDLHDIDGVIPLETFEKDPNAQQFYFWLKSRGLAINNDNTKFKKEIEPRLKQLNWYQNVLNTLPGFKLDVAFIGKDHKNAESVTITGHVLHPTNKDENGEPAKVVLDFFLRTIEGNYLEIFDNYFKDWKQIFEAKLAMGRAKDLNDLLFFVPFKTDINKFTNKGFRYFTFSENGPKESKKNVGDLLETLVDNNKESIFDKKEQLNTKTTSELDFDVVNTLFDNNIKSASTANVLNNIFNYFQSTSPQAKDVLARIDLLAKYAKPTVKFVKESDLVNADTLMQYSKSKNEIQIAVDRLEGHTVEHIAEAFLHEVTHSVTVSSLQSDSLEGKLLRSRIEKVFNEYKAQGNSEYGFSSLEEFVAEAFTSSDFQNALKDIDSTKTKTLWNKFVDFIAKVLGFDVRSNYSKTLESIVDVIKSDTGYTTASNTDIFETKTKDSKEKGFKKVDLSTYEDKINNLYDRLQNSLKAQSDQLRGVKYNKKGVLGDLKRDNIKLTNLMEENEAVNKIKGILHYVNEIEFSLNMLKKSMSKPNISKEDMEHILGNYKKYHSYYSAIDDIKKLYDTAIKDSSLPNTLGSKKLLTKLENLTSSYKQIDRSFGVVSKLFFKENLNNPLYFPKVEVKFREKLAKEYQALYKGNTAKLNDKAGKKMWINKKMIESKDEIQLEVKKAIDDLVDSPAFDINYFTQNFLSALETNSDIVQMTQVILSEIRDNIIVEVTPIHKKLANLHSKLTKVRKINDPAKLYENMIDYDEAGNAFLRTEYKPELYHKFAELARAKSTLSHYENKPESVKDEELVEKARELQNRLVELNNDIYVWKGKVRVIAPKWKNTIKSLSAVEQESITYLKELLELSHTNTLGFSTLTPNFGDIKFFKLPSITKTTLERVLQKQGKSIIKDKFKDLTTVRVDDVGYEATDAAGNAIKEIPIHFRGAISKKDQSLDLFGIMALESQNSISFKRSKEKEILLNAILDTAKGKTYYKTKGLSNSPLLSKYTKKNRELVTSEEESANSKTVKRLEGLLETGLYGVTKKAQGSIAGIDKHKAVGTLNAYTGMLGMSLNYHSGVANATGSYAQILMEALTNDSLSINSLKKANKLYSKYSLESLHDTAKTFDDSFTNQINKMFDTFGGFQIGKTDFLKNNVWKSFANIHSLQMFNSLGEHQIQSVITMAMLNEIKALNKEGNYLTNAGKPTTNIKEAASLLDMLERDKNGLVKMNENVVFSEHSNVTGWDKGGRVQVQQLIKHKIFKLLGNYDSNLQPEIMKLSQGRLLMMYRRYFVPMYMNRFRGIGTANKRTEDLEEHEKYFAFGAKQYEEGIYTTSIRFILNGVIPALKQGRLRLVTEDWANLSEQERSNIYKTLIEAGMALLVGILSGIVAEAADDDDDFLMFFAYILRRTESELNQYRKFSEFQRIIKSPFAGMRSITNTINAFERLIYFSEWDERYKSGVNKGNLKVIRSWEKLIPVLGRNTSDADKLSYLNSPMFSGS
tara:strand:+ start:1444 stop:7116 length:5673 start_codon:yes stop_codon:yes gene_type:complete